jgi:hypothetical protein
MTDSCVIHATRYLAHAALPFQLLILKAQIGGPAEQATWDSQPLWTMFAAALSLAVVGRLGLIPLCEALGWI